MKNEEEEEKEYSIYNICFYIVFYQFPQVERIAYSKFIHKKIVPKKLSWYSRKEKVPKNILDKTNSILHDENNNHFMEILKFVQMIIQYYSRVNYYSSPFVNSDYIEEMEEFEEKYSDDYKKYFEDLFGNEEEKYEEKKEEEDEKEEEEDEFDMNLDYIYFFTKRSFDLKLEEAMYYSTNNNNKKKKNIPRMFIFFDLFYKIESIQSLSRNGEIGNINIEDNSSSFLVDSKFDTWIIHPIDKIMLMKKNNIFQKKRKVHFALSLARKNEKNNIQKYCTSISDSLSDDDLDLLHKKNMIHNLNQYIIILERYIDNVLLHYEYTLLSYSNTSIPVQNWNSIQELSSYKIYKKKRRRKYLELEMKKKRILEMKNILKNNKKNRMIKKKEDNYYFSSSSNNLSSSSSKLTTKVWSWWLLYYILFFVCFTNVIIYL